MTSGTCARQRRALTRVLDLEPGTGVCLPPEAAYSCPHASRKEVPRQDWILEPCGHGAEALLEEPPSYVQKCVGNFFTRQRARGGVCCSEWQRLLY